MQREGMMTFTELAPAASDLPEPFTDRLRLAVAAYLVGAGDEPGGVLHGEAGEPGGLGDRQLDGGDAWQAGLPAVTRHG
jgi:hypothetical protein